MDFPFTNMGKTVGKGLEMEWEVQDCEPVSSNLSQFSHG